MIGAPPKNSANFAGSMVAEVTITLRSGRAGNSVFSTPNSRSMLRLRSCASSMINVS
jgi:hypothetical protein